MSTIRKKLNKIDKLSKQIEDSIPYNVWTTFGKINVAGDVICFGENDYKTPDEILESAQWIIDNLK